MQQASITQQTASILLVEDHEMVRRGMKNALEMINPHFRFRVSEAESAEAALELVTKKKFDLVIIDYRLPGMNGDEGIRAIKAQHGTLKVLAMSLYDDAVVVQNMMRAGADGFILKNVDSAQLLQAVQAVLKGEKYYTSEQAGGWVEIESEQARVRNLYNKYALTQREIEILRLIAREKTNEDISRQLFISKRTVDTHRQNLLHKLQVKNTAGLVLAAIELKLL